MFKKNKWQAWYDAQPAHIKEWIDQPRAIWYDKDVALFCSIALVVGWCIGYFVR
jgi:hypothetical protein